MLTSIHDAIATPGKRRGTLGRVAESPYEMYELRSPSERASSILPSPLVRQPSIALTRTSFHRALADDAVQLHTGLKSSELPTTYPRPFCMPSRLSLLDPLTDDDSMLSLASERPPSRRPQMAHVWEAPLDADAIRRLASAHQNDLFGKSRESSSELSQVLFEIKSTPTSTRSESRFGFKAMRHVPKKPVTSDVGSVLNSPLSKQGNADILNSRPEPATEKNSTHVAGARSRTSFHDLVLGRKNAATCRSLHRSRSCHMDTGTSPPFGSFAAKADTPSLHRQSSLHVLGRSASRHKVQDSPPSGMIQTMKRLFAKRKKRAHTSTC
jgi:hypothetical protein